MPGCMAPACMRPVQTFLFPHAHLEQDVWPPSDMAIFWDGHVLLHGSFLLSIAVQDCRSVAYSVWHALSGRRMSTQLCAPRRWQAPAVMIWCCHRYCHACLWFWRKQGSVLRSNISQHIITLVGLACSCSHGSIGSIQSVVVSELRI